MPQASQSSTAPASTQKSAPQSDASAHKAAKRHIPSPPALRAYRQSHRNRRKYPRPSAHKRQRHPRQHAQQQQPQNLHAHQPQAESRSREKILRRAANDVPHARVPVNAHRLPRLGHPGTESASFTSLPSFMSSTTSIASRRCVSDRLVRAAPNQLKRATPDIAPANSDCSRATAARPAKIPSRKMSSRSSRPIVNIFARPSSGIWSQSLLFRQRHRAPQQVRREMHVRIGENQPLAGGMLERLLQRMRFAQPAGGKGRNVYEPSAARPRAPRSAKSFPWRLRNGHSQRSLRTADNPEPEMSPARRAIFPLRRAPQRESKRSGNAHRSAERHPSIAGIHERPKRQINRLHKPHQRGQSQQSAPEPMQRPISSSALRANKLCYHAACRARFPSSAQDAWGERSAAPPQTRLAHRRRRHALGSHRARRRPRHRRRRAAFHSHARRHGCRCNPIGGAGRRARRRGAQIGEPCRQKLPRQDRAAHQRRAGQLAFCAARRCGAATGSMHPMQTFSERSQPSLKGVIFAVEGDRRARAHRWHNCPRTWAAFRSRSRAATSPPTTRPARWLPVTRSRS